MKETGVDRGETAAIERVRAQISQPLLVLIS